MYNNKEVLTPAWVLMSKVEADFEEYMFFHTNEDPEDEKKETFPLYDSTDQALKSLELVGIKFDTSTGLWKE